MSGIVLPVLPWSWIHNRIRVEADVCGSFRASESGFISLLSSGGTANCVWSEGRVEQLETLVDRWVGIEGLCTL